MQSCKLENVFSIFKINNLFHYVLFIYFLIIMKKQMNTAFEVTFLCKCLFEVYVS